MIDGLSCVLLTVGLLAVAPAQAAPPKKAGGRPLLGRPAPAEPEHGLTSGEGAKTSSPVKDAAGLRAAGDLAAKVNLHRLKISSIAKNTGRVTAVDAAQARTIEFQVSDPNVLKALNLGQRVWLEPGRSPAAGPGRASPSGVKGGPAIAPGSKPPAAAGGQLAGRRSSPAAAGGSSAGSVRAGQLVAKVVKFPMVADQQNNVATGHMKSTVKLSNTGVLTGTTRTWTNNEIQGFTGGVKVELQDRDGNVLKWDMPVQTYGVNAKALTASAPSSRTADWRFDVPAEVVNQTARIRILHRHTPQGRLDQFVDIAWELGKLAEFYVGLAKDVGAVASGGQTPGTTGPTEPAP
jgi:hypothetical protein